MTADATKRVDVYRYLPGGELGMSPHDNGDYVMHSDYAALLQQVVELEQSYRESCDITRDWIAANNALSARATVAEAKLAERDAAIVTARQWALDEQSGGLRMQKRAHAAEAALREIESTIENAALAMTELRKRAEAAERARDEACGLLLSLKDSDDCFIDDGPRELIVNFLAANGG